jgi:hypothetical protein
MATMYHRGPAAWTKRPHFAPGQQLTAQGLNGIVDDALRRQRLITRVLNGFGVAFGYALTRQDQHGRRPPEHDHCGCRDGDHRLLKLGDHHAIEMSCGLIIDRHGRDLFWPGGCLCVADTVGKRPDREGWYVLAAHYAERREPPDGCAPCPSDRVQWIEQSVAFSLTWHERCPQCEHQCDCPPAQCATLCDYVCGRTGSSENGIPAAPDLAEICRKPDELCESECGCWRYDAGGGIPIACLRVENEIPPDAKCGPRFVFADTAPSICTVRPFVYRTPLLYELVRDCHVDLARVESLSWQDWLVPEWSKKIPWDSFTERVLSEDPSPKAGFKIWFTRPIEIRTLHRASIILRAITRSESENHFRIERRIPLRELRPLEIDPATGKYARGVQIIFSRQWEDGEIRHATSMEDGAQIELTIRAQMLRDECGRMPDARPFGVDLKWSGQSRPGDDFVATFRVAPAPEKQKSQDADDDDEDDGQAARPPANPSGPASGSPSSPAS